MKFLAEERSHYQRETKSLLLKKEAQDHLEEHKVGTTTRTMATRETKDSCGHLHEFHINNIKQMSLPDKC